MAEHNGDRIRMRVSEQTPVRMKAEPASRGITPEGGISIYSNGTYNVTNYAAAYVEVPGGVDSITIRYESERGTAPDDLGILPYTLTSKDVAAMPGTHDWAFDGWTYADGSKAKAGDTISADTTLTAAWKAITYEEITISYESDHGTAPSSKTVEYVTGESYTLTAADLPTLTADGYIFRGWSKSAGAKITEDTTLTAAWTVDTRPIVYYGVASGDLPTAETIAGWGGQRTSGSISYTRTAGSGKRIFFVCPASFAASFYVTVDSMRWPGGYEVAGSATVNGVACTVYRTNASVGSVLTEATIS